MQKLDARLPSYEKRPPSLQPKSTTNVWRMTLRLRGLEALAEYDYESDSDLEDSEEPEESEETCERVFTSKEVDGAVRVDRKGSISAAIGTPENITSMSDLSEISSCELELEEVGANLSKGDSGPATKAVADVIPLLARPSVSPRQRVVFAPYGTYKTWRVVVLYLYNVSFAPLRTQRDFPLTVPEGPTCSPKSMYRLATKLGLTALQDKAFHAVKAGLSRDNIVDELFSDFTWRFENVLEFETDLFRKYSSDEVVNSALSKKFYDVAQGRYPHAHIVLDSLFHRTRAIEPLRKITPRKS